MGHGELRRRFRRGRVWEEEKEIETVRNTAGVTEERVCLCADMNMQSKQISFKPQTLLSCLSILHQASPTHWLRGYLFNNSYQYFMQRINNAFDHPLSVADAAAISFFTSSRWPGLASIKSARDMDQAKTGEVEGKERLHMNKAVLTLQPSLPFRWYSRHVSMGYLSSSGWHPHTLSFITNASAAKLQLRDKCIYLKSFCRNLFAQLCTYWFGGVYFCGNPSP